MKRCAFVAAIVLCAWISHASLIFIPSDYGLSAEAASLANAGVAIGENPFGSYYNPAFLAVTEGEDTAGSQLAIGYLYALPQFDGGPKGDTEKFSESNQAIVLGMELALDSLFKKPYPLSFGLTLVADDNTNAFLHFTDGRSDKGEFQRYGISSVGISAGLGAKVYGPIYLGVGGLVGIQASTTMILRTTMGGKTSDESIEMKASPSLAPVVGIGLDWKKLNVGVTYRGKMVSKVGPVDASTQAVVGGSDLATIPLELYFKDGYVPQQVALGALWRISDLFSVDLQADWLNWSDFSKEVEKKDNARKEIELETKDIFVPRVGIEIDPLSYLAVRLGYRYEETPFDKVGSGNNVVLDNSRHVASLGVGVKVEKPPLLSKPLDFDLTYSLFSLVARDIDTPDGRTFESSGMLHNVLGTLTVRF